jgi:solute carrier family 25 S-adenosylmethionine transporter 26
MTGIITDILCYPLETLKTRLQVSRKIRIKSNIRNLYDGVILQAIGSFPMTATYFIFYEGTKYTLDHLTVEVMTIPMHIKSFIGAMVGEVMGCLVANPVEYLKQNIQVGNHTGIMRFLKDVIRRRGVRGLYQGYVSLLGREVPFSCLQMPIYEVGERLK